MRFVDDIPKQHIPNEDKHVNHLRVVRALIDDKCNIRSFLPTFLEPGRMNSASFDPNDPESYALSLYRTVEELNVAVHPFKSFWKTHKGYAIGKTCLDKGISFNANPITGHIAYFLYDTYNNNPCVDFERLESQDENEND